MAYKIVIVTVIVLLGLAHSVPVGTEEDAEFVPGNVYRHSSPASTDLVPGGFSGIGFPDFTRIQEYFDAIRKRITETFAGGFDGVDLDNANKTSETRIINGNKVTINRTIYENNGVHYIVKNIQVRPLDGSGESTTPGSTFGSTGSTPGRDIETYDNEINREILKEGRDEVDRVESRKKRNDFYGNRIDDFDFQPIVPFKPYDLSGDTNVNYKGNLPLNPDAETFPPFKNYYEYEIRQPVIPPKKGWIDLGHDTDVNRHLAQKGFRNPDAEYFPPTVATIRPYDLSRDTYINEKAAERFPPNYFHPDAERFHPSERPKLAPIRYESSDIYARNYMHSYETNKPIDLARDVYVNQLAANNYVRPDPDVEVFQPFKPIASAKLERPVDFSRDTYVNELARQRGVRPDPDVEFFGAVQSPQQHPILYRPQTYQYHYVDPRKK